jgi:hypothetical protein
MTDTEYNLASIVRKVEKSKLNFGTIQIELKFNSGRLCSYRFIRDEHYIVKPAQQQNEQTAVREAKGQN